MQDTDVSGDISGFSGLGAAMVTPGDDNDDWTSLADL